jgi:long-subunit acyl-CoA synthetase (AMP-forming)
MYGGKVCKDNTDRLKPYEVPHGVVVCAEEWTDVNRCLTPSLKVRREFIRNVYKDDVNLELAKFDVGVEKSK